jgi:post-segregation antitoxin (ccd killing protein)
MSKYITVSAKVRKELLDEARKLNINVSELIRSTLENEVRRRKLLLLEEKLKNQKSILDKINIDDIVKIIREDRESR